MTHRKPCSAGRRTECTRHRCTAARSSRRHPIPPRGFDLRREPYPEELARGEAAPREGAEGELYCFVCGAAITRERERVSVEGAHEHTFTNPAGFVFRIGCFRSAPGCVETGEFTAEASWFRGRAWRYAACAGCRAHLGWVYRDRGDAAFFGLILNRLLGSRQLFASES